MHHLQEPEPPHALSDLLDELLDLEADYYATLSSLLDSVLPVLDASNALSAEKKKLFSNLHELRTFSSQFLEDLSRVQLPEHRTLVALVIQDALERSAAVYDLYYRRYPLTADVVCQLAGDQHISGLLKRLFSADKRIWPLDVAFGKPLQIFFNYKLLILRFMDAASGDLVLLSQLSTINNLLAKILEKVYRAREAALDWEAMRNFEKHLDLSKLRDTKSPQARLDSSRCPSLLTFAGDADELARRRMVMVESFREISSLCPMLGRRMGPRTQFAAMVRPRGRINLHLFTDVLVVVRPMSRSELAKRADNKTGYLLWVPLPLTDVDVWQYKHDENIGLMVDGQLTLALQASSFAAKEKWLSEFMRLKDGMTERAIVEILTAMSSATLRNSLKRFSDGGERSEDSEAGSPKADGRKGGWISGMSKAILHGGKDGKSKPDLFATSSTATQSSRLFQHRVLSSPSLAPVFTNAAVKSTDLPAPPLSATFPLVTRLFNAKASSDQQPSSRTFSSPMVVSMPVSLPGSHQPHPTRCSTRIVPLTSTSEAARMSANNSIVGLLCRTGDCHISVWREPVWQSFKGGRCRAEVKRTATGRACLVAVIVKKPKVEAQGGREEDTKEVALVVDSWRSSESNSSVITTAHRPGRNSVAVEPDDDEENERQVLNAWIESSTDVAVKGPSTVLVEFALQGGRSARYMIECCSKEDAHNLFESVRGQIILAILATEDSPDHGSLQKPQGSPSSLPAGLGGAFPPPQEASHRANSDDTARPVLHLKPFSPSAQSAFSATTATTTSSLPPTPSSPAAVHLLECRCKLYVLCADPEYWCPLGRGMLTVSASQSGRDHHVAVAAGAGPLLVEVPYRSVLLEDGLGSLSSSEAASESGAHGILCRLGNGRFTITVRRGGKKVVYLVVYTETPDSYDVLWRKAAAI